MTSSGRIELDLAALLGRAAAPAPPAGGRDVCALIGALGAATASMAFHAVADEGASEEPDYMRGRATELVELRNVLLAAVGQEPEGAEDDLEAMEHGLAALRLVAVGAPRVPVESRGDVVAAARCLRASIEAAGARLGDEPTERQRATADTLLAQAKVLLEEVSA